MIVLALDIASVTGWAAGPAGEVPRCGSVRMVGNGASDGATQAAFSDWFADMLALHKPDRVAYEAPLVRFVNQNTAKLAFRLSGLVELICWRRNIPCTACNVSTIRAQVCGNGNCGKDGVAAWFDTMGWPVPLRVGEPDHDALDAASVWAFATGIRAQERMI